MSERQICLCWLDEGDECSHQKHKGSLTTCESYEIWRKCLDKEDINFEDDQIK